VVGKRSARDEVAQAIEKEQWWNRRQEGPFLVKRPPFILKLPRLTIVSAKTHWRDWNAGDEGIGASYEKRKPLADNLKYAATRSAEEVNQRADGDRHVTIPKGSVRHVILGERYRYKVSYKVKGPDAGTTARKIVNAVGDYDATIHQGLFSKRTATVTHSAYTSWWRHFYGMSKDGAQDRVNEIQDVVPTLSSGGPTERDP
jgi:hypothetical protein